MSGENWVDLTSPADGAVIPAFHVEAGDARRAGLVLFQEIFGVNANMRALAHKFAAIGYEVLVPAYYHRVEPGFDAGYDADGIQKGLKGAYATPWDQAVADTQAAIDWLSRPDGKVVCGGFCWGGSLAFTAASGCKGLAGAASFYGRLMFQQLERAPKIPIEYHFGRDDASIPMSEVDRLREAYPDAPVFVYDAGHGFFSDRGHDFKPDAADLAFSRTLRFFHGLVGKGEA
jgi:carboxymethylenebutenolidase